mgnify:CR=1 FL=1
MLECSCFVRCIDEARARAIDAIISKRIVRCRGCAATTFIAENVNKEELYEVLDEVRCPQMVLTAGNDHSNEKPGGLANKVWG